VYARTGDRSRSPRRRQGLPVSPVSDVPVRSLHGTPGEYLLRVRQVQVNVHDGEESESDLRLFGPWEVSVPGENYVECFGLSLPNVSFPEAGVYEFQLWADGFDEPLGRERIQARE
jgi:hypothetical protein